MYVYISFARYFFFFAAAIVCKKPTVSAGLKGCVVLFCCRGQSSSTYGHLTLSRIIIQLARLNVLD